MHRIAFIKVQQKQRLETKTAESHKKNKLQENNFMFLFHLTANAKGCRLLKPNVTPPSCTLRIHKQNGSYLKTQWHALFHSTCWCPNRWMQVKISTSKT